MQADIDVMALRVETGVAMECLWAPWRMDYIRGCRNDEQCFLCGMVAVRDSDESLVVAVGESCAVCLNKFPYTNGHLMVFPLEHVSCLEEIAESVHLEMMQMVTRATLVLRAVMAPDGFNVGLNLGAVAGAGLESHLHMHVVPRWGGDSNFMSVTAGVRVIPQDLQVTRAELVAAWCELS